jgi:hypothetical protein
MMRGIFAALGGVAVVAVCLVTGSINVSRAAPKENKKECYARCDYERGQCGYLHDYNSGPCIPPWNRCKEKCSGERGRDRAEPGN